MVAESGRRVPRRAAIVAAPAPSGPALHVTAYRMILVTGASGFVGRRYIARLAAAGRPVAAALRARGADLPAEVSVRVIGGIGASTDWSGALRGVGTVVHCAGLAHVLDRERAADAEPYFEVNERGSATLARAAAAAGVKRLVFLSSTKVHGDATGRRVIGESDAPAPGDPYGASKWRAELALSDIAARTGLELVILRPPLVYGPGVKANFARLVDWIDRGVPLPLGAIRNRRSLVSIENLCAAIDCALVHPRAPGGTFIVTDGEDVSTPELIRRLARALDTRARLIAVPPLLLRLAATLAGRGADYERLAGDAAFSSRRLREQLGFSPPQSLDDGLRELARAYRVERAPRVGGRG